MKSLVSSIKTSGRGSIFKEEKILKEAAARQFTVNTIDYNKLNRILNNTILDNPLVIDFPWKKLADSSQESMGVELVPLSK